MKSPYFPPTRDEPLATSKENAGDAARPKSLLARTGIRLVKPSFDHGDAGHRISRQPIGVAVVLTLFLGASSQSPKAERQADPRGSIGNTSPNPQSSADNRQPSEALLTAADEVFQEVSRITGLPIKAPLKKEVVNRDQMRQRLVESLHADYAPGEMHAQETMLKAFGLVGPDFDLEQFLIRFYTEQAAGVYDPRRKTMLIADWTDKDTQKAVLAHELTHALQDQNFDLQKFLEGRREDDDATAARQAIAEGHATAAMVQMMMAPQKLEDVPTAVPLMNMAMQLQIEQYPVFSSAPFFFRYQALFSYAQGVSFMERGLAEGGWQELRDFFLHPPQTTKEIFDPDVYFKHQRLPEMKLPDPKPMEHGARLRVVDRNRMGQLGYYCLLAQLLSEDEAKKVAPSWLADRYLVYEDPDARRYAVVARTRWASAEAAADFFRDLHTILVKKYPNMGTMRAIPPEADGAAMDGTLMGTTSSGAVIMIRRGDEVLWAEGVPTTQADAMRQWMSEAMLDQ